MRIVNLVENTAGREGCGIEHGLSFYIQTERHRILMDTGASSLFSENAVVCGVELGKVDTIILSHGHYDHGGGILKAASLSPAANIYIQETAFEPHFSLHDDGTAHDIGIDPEIKGLSGLHILKGDYRIDDELSLYTGVAERILWPAGNRNMRVGTPQGKQDLFKHEQYLVVKNEGKVILFSGCAHNGIINILRRFRELYGKWPDAVISGFHMMRSRPLHLDELEDIRSTGEILKKLPVRLYTGHCTGSEAYLLLRNILGDQIQYTHCGEEVDI